MYLVTAVRRTNDKIRQWLCENWKNSRGGVIKTTLEKLNSASLDPQELNNAVVIAIDKFSVCLEESKETLQQDSDNFRQLRELLENKLFALREQFVMYWIYRTINHLCIEAEKRLHDTETRKGTESLLLRRVTDLIEDAKDHIKANIDSVTVLENCKLTLAKFFQCCEKLSENVNSDHSSKLIIDCPFQDYTDVRLLSVEFNRAAADYFIGTIEEAPSAWENSRGCQKAQMIMKYQAVFLAQNGDTQESCDKILDNIDEMHDEEKKQRNFTPYAQKFSTYCNEIHRKVIRKMEGTSSLTPGKHYQCHFG